MTHEYKHYIDLSQFDGHTPGEWNHHETEGGVSFIEDANGNPLFEAHNAGLQDCRLVGNTTRTLAYARELEARVKELEKERNDREWANGAHRTQMLNELVDKAARIADLERQLAYYKQEATEANDHENYLQEWVDILEHQLAEATTWRSPETAPMDGTWFIGYYDTDKILGTRADPMCAKDDPYTWLTNEGFLVKHKTLVGWIPLPLPKEDV